MYKVTVVQLSAEFADAVANEWAQDVERYARTRAEELGATAAAVVKLATQEHDGAGTPIGSPVTVTDDAASQARAQAEIDKLATRLAAYDLDGMTRDEWERIDAHVNTISKVLP